MKLRVLITIAFVALFAASPTLAGKKFGRQVRFAGIHPIPKSEGGGICHIQGPHVHIYAANKLEYRVHDDDYVFVGDPVAYGWDGPKYAYKGNHPIQVNAVVGGDPDVVYCYINGPHYHYFEPEQPDFKLVGGAYFYVGTPPPAYVDARPQYVAINATYEPIVYTRPVIEVAPPEGWIGARVDLVGPAVVVETPPPVVVAPHATVVAPGIRAGIEVHVPPPPTIEVGIGVHVGGGVVVGPGPRKHGKFKQKKWKRH
jgi:hypothetical protein